DLYQKACETGAGEYQVLGFIDSPNGHRVPEEIKSRMLGPIEALDDILMKRVVDNVMIAMPIKSCYDQIQRAIATCERAGVESEFISQPFALSVARPHLVSDASTPVLRLKVVTDDFRLIVKRLIDLAGALVGLAVCAPLMAVVALAIVLTSRGPV